MSDDLRDLLDLLLLEQIEENLFRGQTRDPGWGRLYGGLVVGQALSAAAATVPAARTVHSMHAYFLRMGDPSIPVVYTVDPIRDGRSFNTRRVVAIQRGKAILNLSASYQIAEEGLEHQLDPPGAPGPEGLPSQLELARLVAHLLPEGIRERVLRAGPLEVRPVRPYNPLAPDVRPPTHQAWFKARAPLPDDPSVHRYLLAYASDSHFLTTALHPHGVSWLTKGIQMASLDHAMWFHRPFRVDEWLLYDVESTVAAGARAVVRGRFFDVAGRLVASTMQEGLVRDWRDKGDHDG